MRTLTIVAIMLASVANAQPKPPGTGNPPVVLDPAEIDTIGCDFEDWTLTGAGSVSVRLIPPARRSDASPSSIVVAGPTLSGNRVSARINPDQGCGATGCRTGNSYQITFTAAEGSNTPKCHRRVDVRQEVFQ